MGILDSLFSGGDAYQEYYDRAQKALEQHEATGRGDIKAGTEEAIGYGAPYRQAGESGLQEYLNSLGLGGSGAQQGTVDRFRASPGYQFALQQGLQGVQRAMGPRGLTGSGAEARELQRTGQGLADQEYQQFQNRLSNLAGMGQQMAGQAGQFAYGAGGQLANLGTQYGSQLSNLYQNWGQQAQQQQQAAAGGIGSLLGAIPGIVSGVPGFVSALSDAGSSIKGLF